MANLVELSFSDTFAIPLADAYSGLIPIPLNELFNKRFGPIPPIRGVEGQDGDWGTVGQTRTIRMADGNSMREELTHADPPNAFGYTITEVTGPLKPLAARVEGMWTFEAAGTGTRITWRWRVQPASPLVRPLMPVFGWLWRGNARQGFRRIGELLAASN